MQQNYNCANICPEITSGKFLEANARYRESMEDFCLLAPEFFPGNSLYAVFDGHGGSKAAETCIKHFEKKLIGQMMNKETESMEQKLIECFLEIDELICQMQNVSSGTTAAVCWLLWEKGKGMHLCCGNVGDSRVILSRALTPMVISCEHNAKSNSEERKRIKNNGGFIYNERVYGVCAVTRALGDAQYKECIIGHPHIFESILSWEDKWIVIASDGLWSVVGNEEAHMLLMKHENAQLAAESLGKLALEYGTTDNVGIVVLKIDWVVAANKEIEGSF